MRHCRWIRQGPMPSSLAKSSESVEAFTKVTQRVHTIVSNSLDMVEKHACFRPYLFLPAHQPLLTSADGYWCLQGLGMPEGKEQESGPTQVGVSSAPVTAVVLSPCDQDHRRL